MSLNDLLYKYLLAEGYTGSLQDMWSAHPLSQFTRDELYRYLEVEGFTGSINESLYGFLKLQLSTPVE